MKSTRAAKRYATAILELAQDQNAAELVNMDMVSIVPEAAEVEGGTTNA